MRTLVGKVSILEGQSLACICGRFVVGLVQGVLQKATLDLVDVYLIRSHVPNGKRLLVEIHLQVEDAGQLMASLLLFVDFPLGDVRHWLDIDLSVLEVGWGEVEGWAFVGSV